MRLSCQRRRLRALPTRASWVEVQVAVVSQAPVLTSCLHTARAPGVLSPARGTYALGNISGA